MADTEEYFPRGGKKPTVTYFKQSGNFLGAVEKGERKKKKQKKKSEDDDGYLSDDGARDVDKSFKNCASRLSYKTIKAGVTILGRVRQAQETKLNVSLPGNMAGTVMACHISETYNKQLEAYVNDQTEKIRELPEMFRPGQYVAVKVLEVEGTKLMLTMMPQHVNSGRTHSDLYKGDLLQAAVSSVEDHGYVMDIGIPNTRPFLPKSNVNPEIELDAGVLTWCCIKSITPSADSSIVTLSNSLEALQNCSPRKKASQLLPGTPVLFAVDKPLDNGIEGHVFDEMTAYIQRQHADKVKGKKPGLGQRVRARLLYVMPTRNTPFLTMKDIFETTYPNLEEEQKLKEGDIVEEALVLRILGRSVHLKLGKGCVGTMSMKRIQVDEDLADEEVVAKSYPVGSTHRVRVVAYNLADYTYSVSDRADVLAERYFSLDQVAVGDIVDATVSTVADNHLLVSVGRLTGYIPQTHYSDAGIFIDPKKAHLGRLSRRFRPDAGLRARALVVDRARAGLLLTVKPSLLDPGLEVLKSYEQAEVGKAYTGFIRLIRDYILVSFFDNVTCLVPRQYVSKEPLENLSDAFHLGQIVTCTILRVDPENKKMNGSLTTTPFWPAPKRETAGKRKHDTEATTDVPNKKHKQKQSDQQDDTKDKKKKKNKEDSDEIPENTETKKKKDKKRKDSASNDEDLEEESKTKKKSKKIKPKNDNDSDESELETDSKNKKKNKKDKSKNEESNKVSEESDAIETDIHEDSDQVLTPEDLYLIDLSDCDNIGKCKKRILSLTKNVNARTRRIDRIDEKILRIESKGLSAKNKMYHTAMHSEKLVIQERIQKLLVALKKAQEKLKDLGYVEDADRKEKKEKKKRKESTTEDEAGEEPKEVKEVQKKTKETKKKKKESIVEDLEPVLEIPSAKDFWATNPEEEDAKPVQDEESSSSDEEEQTQPKKKRKKLSVAEKLAKVREEEERVREMERRAADSDARPRSSDQFERALLANPDCSQLWIAYMAFHLQSTEIEKARAVARRALAAISFREEADKLNVWLALLNLEHRFGTNESQQKVLEEALQMNDTYQVHSKLLDIYAETSRAAELASLVDLMGRRYRRAEAYVRCGAACFQLGLVDKARQVMQKAISVLEKKEHVSVLVQFAQLERAHGQRERAEALCEQVLAVYPQRVDVAAAHAHALLKQGDQDRARQLMERMTSLKLPARKMKILYKTWIELEEKIGDEAKVEEVRQRAMEFIEKAKF